MIGGIDMILEAPPGDYLVELILRRIRHFWPDARYQNADDAEVYSVRDGWLSISGSQATEFFIYKNEKAAQSWDRYGAIAENRNTMIHFLVDKSSFNDLQQITLVCDEETAEMRHLAKDLQENFLNSMEMVFA